jgi:hypothetical protein
MDKGLKEIFGISLISICLCLISGKSLIIPVLSLILALVARFKDLLKIDMIIFILHCLTSCYWLGMAEKGWEERLGWVVCTSQGWYLGQNYAYEGIKYTMTSKIITLIWLNYWYGFDIITPNFIGGVPMLVYKFQDAQKLSTKEDRNGTVIVTNSHTYLKSSEYSLKTLCLFQPLSDSLPISTVFYQSSSGLYEYKLEQYQVISVINGSSVYIHVKSIS